MGGCKTRSKSRFKLFQYLREESHAADAEAGFFKERADLLRVVALEFDLAVVHGSAAAAGLAGVAGEAFDFGVGDGIFESRDDDDGFAASPGFFAAEDHAAVFAGRFGFCGRNWLGGAFGESVELEGGEGGL